MTTKLTLSLDAEIVAKAKRIAARKGTSISKMVDNYFSKFPEEKKSEKDLNAIIGCLKTDKEVTKQDIKDARFDYLKKKYGL